jgi:endonuclease G, mitochondrial
LVIRSTEPLYVLTGPLYERLMKPLPALASRHRVPSGYWKIVAQGTRISAFIFDQATPRSADPCEMRVPLEEVILRARLLFFPEMDLASLTSLDAELECTTPAPPRPLPSEIPAEP